MLGSEEKILELEYNLFCELRSILGQECQRIRKTAKALAQLDCLIALAEVAHEFDYVQPFLHIGEELVI